MNLLGIDYGEKRIGLAFGDETGFARPLPAATQAKKKERLAAIGEVIAARRVAALVVGYPLNMDGSAGFKAREVDAFIATLEKRFGLPVHRIDERLTSRTAEAGLRESGRRVSRESGEVDSRAAAVLLQDYLDQKGGPALLPSEEEDGL